MKRIVHTQDVPWLPKRFPNEEKLYGTYRSLTQHHSTEQFEVRITRLMPDEQNTKYHAHSRTEEWFYVLTGCCKVALDGRWFDIGARDSIHTSPGTMHMFRNASEQVCEIIMLGTNHEDDQVDREPEPSLDTQC